MLRTIALLIILSYITGCASGAYTNVKKDNIAPPQETRASFSINRDRGSHERTLAILALSGGGSRAAYWSAAVMLALEEVYRDEGLNILDEIDVISSVSGGSLPAAYYVISSSPDDKSRAGYGRVWDEETVKELMSRSFRSIWFRRWFLPQNIVRYWFTAFDRSDIMARVFADHLYERRPGGADLCFKDINPERPYLIINATNGTRGRFGRPFTFTREDFERLNSDVEEYEISRGVMASASFPAVFHSMTLRDFAPRDGADARFVHVLDGGIIDNLGLGSVKKVLERNRDEFDRVVIILVDAHVDTEGASDTEYDTRSMADYVVDENFLDSVGILMTDRRKVLLEDFRQELKKYRDKTVLFYHIEFNDLSKFTGGEELGKRLDKIKTDFNLTPEATAKDDIDSAVRLLIVKENECLDAIRSIIVEKEPRTTGGVECKWPKP